MIITKEFKTESGTIITLIYTVTQGSDGWYGVRIHNSKTGECCDADSLSPNLNEVTELLATISRCGVTPVTLRDVAYDWLCNKYTA